MLRNIYIDHYQEDEILRIKIGPINDVTIVQL